MAKCRFAYNNLAQYAEKFFDYVFLFTTAFSDLTEAARNPTTGDVVATGSSTSHYLAVGMKAAKFYHVRLLLSAAASAGTRNWQYWNGSAFTTFTATFLRGNKDFTTTTDYFIDGIWRVADVSGWAKTTLNGKYAYWLIFQVATTTNTPTFSQISNRTIIASSEQTLSLPGSHAGTASPADAWKSRYNKEIEIIPGRLDKMDYDIGAAELTLTLTPGVYRPAALLSHIETQLGAGFTASHSDVSGATITKASGTLNLRCATGTNKATSIYAALGFDCSSNKTGALTYTSSYPKTSSGGTFYFAANTTGEFNDGSNRSISLPAGTYSAGSLQAKTKQLMDASGGGFTDFDVKYDEESLNFTLKRAGGNISIINSSPLFATSMKIADVASAASHSGTVAIHNTDAEWLILTEPIENLNDIALFGTNFQIATASVKLDHLSAAATWTNLGSFTLAEGRAYYQQTDAAAPDNAIYRILINDADNPDGYVQVGTIAAFDFGNGYFETSLNIKELPSKTSEGFEDLSESSSGQVTSTLIGERTVHNFEMYAITTADTTSLLAMQSVIGMGAPFLFIQDRDLAIATVTTALIWGRLGARMTFKELNKPGLIHEYPNLVIVEFI